MKSTSLSVIIPVFNGLEYTRKCIHSLNNQEQILSASGVSMSIILVDDGSTDGTSEWVQANYPGVHVIMGDGNLWWSGAINKGVEFALDRLNSEYILWWNNDILPAKDYFEKLSAIIQNSSPNTIIGSKIYMLKGDLIWGMGGKFDPVSGKKYMYGERTPDSDLYRKPMAVDWFPGMGTCFHKSVFAKVGMLDASGFPQYHGDSDFTYRTKKGGYNLVAFPELVIYNDDKNTGLMHHGKFSNLYKSLVSIKSNQNIKKDILFFNKHASSPLAYLALIDKYFRYIGGFYKWKFLNAIGVKRN